MLAFGIGVLVAAALAASALALAVSMLRKTARETDGVGYFAAPLAERRAMKARIARRSRWVEPVMRAIATIRPPRDLRMTEHKGVTGPVMTCPADRFAETENFIAGDGDVFVATQMKCGTTWMQQVVYETACRGNGDLGDTGHRHMYALSPWIESRHSVSMEDAPRVGAHGSRIIKTHMPVTLCPYSEKAKYVYVTRHPVACFASVVDFLEMLAGPMCPEKSVLLDWYCSDRMFWRSWPEHVDGWWRWAQERPNVLFVHYEEMLDDLASVVRRVASFLEVDLTGDEVDRVVEKSSFEYMKQNEELFEMSPPSVMTRRSGSFLKSGTKSRDKDVSETERDRILDFCRDRLRGSDYPAARFYPDLADPA